MFDIKILYKILRFVVLVMLIYIILRYTPTVQMSPLDALTFAFVLSVLSLGFEFFCKYCKSSNNNYVEEFQYKCDSCKINNVEEIKKEINIQNYWGKLYDGICTDINYGFGDMFDDNYTYNDNYIAKKKLDENDKSIVSPMYTAGTPIYASQI